MRKYSKFIIVLVITISLTIFVHLFSPKQIDWSHSFSKDDKIPYGSFIPFKILPGLFPQSKIVTSDYPVYNNLAKKEYENTNYIFINYSFTPDELDTKKLLEFVKTGNNVFISAFIIDGMLADSLKIQMSPKYVNDSIKVNFVNNVLIKDHPYVFRKNIFDYYFSDFDTAASVVLGVNNKNHPDFIKINFGHGSFYLNSVPVAFTNYSILDSLNSEYIFKSLSYLPVRSTVFWDEYYKTGKTFIRTPLKFVLSNEPLSWAYYILIFSVIAYIIFEGKRKQRIIPEIKPLQNTTLEFVGIIGKLYYQQKNHKNIAEKKINYFLDHLRNRYFIKTDKIDNETMEKISQKSGLKFKEIKNIFNQINYIGIHQEIADEDLTKINYLVESFYKKAGRYGRSI